MKYLVLLLTTIMLCACSSRNEGTFSHDEKNSVYYWRTIFAPDSADFAFIHRHNIGRIYLRMFDVIMDDNQAIPNATLKIPDESYAILRDSFKTVEFVPVVYITLEALKSEQEQEILAEAIVTRVKNMCSYNELPNVTGLQLDCDWTASTEQAFFALCNSTRRKIEEHGLKWNISSTIRLHQLNSNVPPVDYGVLMVYNTGNFNDPGVTNSILNVKDVKPYLSNLDKYSLHLDVAYPTYSWQLLFHKRKFVGFLNDVNVFDTAKFKYEDTSHIYQALDDLLYKKIIIRKGDVIRTETSNYNEISVVQSLIEEKFDNRPHSNILYHFDLHNFSKYSDDEINNILSVATNK